MAQSLRDQLLKTGLVSKEQASKAEQQAKSKTHQQQKQKKKKRGKTALDTNSAAYLAAKAREEEIERAKELNRQKEKERRQKARQAEVRDLIEHHHVNDPKAEEIYYFLDGKLVKKMEVDFKQREQLDHGQLAISLLEDEYYLVPEAIAEKILERLPESVRCFHKNQEETIEKDEPYADYPVPDDLIW
ncbi:MAG: DUF2058 domain-containing protein [Candidatus Parabeggiatoa sp.]|nr:DUF2058 domain-containing protein [Candidatus Parabeggiatoa sp.]